MGTLSACILAISDVASERGMNRTHNVGGVCVALPAAIARSRQDETCIACWWRGSAWAQGRVSTLYVCRIAIPASAPAV
jgi:hypothetical protein